VSGTVRDPRHFQIAALLSLLALGLLELGFDVTLDQAGVYLAGVLAAQWGFGRAAGVPRFEWRSALISGLSLCLLLRTGSPLLALLGAALTIGSKFVLRWNGKHVFNPTNFGVAATVLATSGAWISPGQWGSSAVLAFAFLCAGGLVAHRALRSDVALAFLAAWTGLLFGRAAWLGDPVTIPLHQLESGSLLLFAFFMISDPRTTPDHRLARIVFGVLVAAGAYYVQFRLYRPGGPLLALFFLSPLVPVLDRLLPGPRYEWPAARPPKGAVDEDAHALPSPARRLPGHARLGLLRLLRRQG
jgi:Na+-transporting NADH:ubiquinone oxidoreductase subunit NqrB